MKTDISPQNLQILAEVIESYVREYRDDAGAFHEIAGKLWDDPKFKSWLRSVCGQMNSTHDSRAFKLLREAEDEINLWKEAFKETVTAFIPFFKKSDIFSFLDKIKEGLASESDVYYISSIVSSLKKNLIEQDPSQVSWAGTEERKTKGFLGKFFGKDNGDVEQIRSDIVQMVNALDPIVPESSKKELEAIKERISVSSSFSDLTEANHHLVDVLVKLSEQIRQEREQLNQFVTELGKNLVEIEKNIMLSIDKTQKSMELNSSFNLHLDTQIKDLNSLASSTAKTLEELRQIVLAKISSIRKALEAKRKQEEIINRELDRRFRRLQRDLVHINQEIHRVQTKERLLKQQVLIDALTGAFNRRAYEQRIQEEWKRFKRYGHVFSLIVLDLDHFKKINDEYGHSAGDLVLKEVVKRIKKNLRECDLLFRYGGEEFVILLPGTDIKGAIEVASKIRGLIQNTKFLYKGDIITVTVSAGVTQVLNKDGDPLEVFDRADSALYQAKASGRNRVVSIPSP